MADPNPTLHLNQVIDCLLEQQKSRSKRQSSSFIKRQSSDNIANLYQNTNELLGEFQGHLNRCKKYNEAKIHRKYEIIINDLQKENNDLKQKVALELNARPSSQKYVSDLIDKMIELKNLNQRLSIQNEKLTNLLVNFQQRFETVLTNNSYVQDQNPENKQLAKKQWEKTLIRDTIKKFTFRKKAQKLSQHQPEPSNFQRFLAFNKGKLERWYLFDLFEKLDKWTAHLKDTRHLDKFKIRNQLNGSILSEEPSDQFPFKTIKEQTTLQKASTQATNINMTPLTSLKRTKLLHRNKDKDTSFRFRSLYKSQRRIQASAFE